MPKERSINPAQAQRKAEKAKSIKKGKAQAQAVRNEKLARRNPNRIQTQLDDLKAVESSGGSLTAHEKSLLASLEADLKAVRKAREALGDKAPAFGGSRGGRDAGRGGRGSGREGGGVLGKRRRDSESEGDSDVPEDVRRIPMPRDTPPPFPKEVLDRWHQARRDRFAREREENGGDAGGRGVGGADGRGNANRIPLGGNDRGIGRRSQDQEDEEEHRPKVHVEAKTVYESAPVVRDLRKEAVAFMPAVVRQKLEKGKGAGGLLEPEEADRLEKEGYLPASKRGDEGRRKNVEMEEVEDEDG